MKKIQGIELSSESNEELLPDFFVDFPYIATCAEFDEYIDPVVPWHWHQAVELFYIKSGRLEYTTPNGKWTFPAGTGGFLNSNVLHSSRVNPNRDGTVQLLHLFDPELLSGGLSNRIEERYIRPLTEQSGIEMICLFPEEPRQDALLQKICAGFELEEGSWGYEIRLRQQLTDIWLGLLEIAGSATEEMNRNKETDEKMKAMMCYIQEHYAETISVNQLSEMAHISKRVCFRLFREKLHMSPLEYITEYRLRKACMKLINTEDSITEIANDCGFGTGSYLGKIFREHFNCSPKQYRKEWHDRDINSHK